MNRVALATAAAALLVALPAGSQEWSEPGDDGGYCGLRTASRYAMTTRSCVACHDGSVGSAVHAGPRNAGGGLGPSHPVGMSYDEAAARHPDRFRARVQLSRRIWLPEGKVTCTTCHDGASREPKHVAIPMSRSALCFECHTM